LAGRLRQGDPAILGYVREDRLHLDMRTINEDELPGLVTTLLGAGDG